jgi:hypothetical protein
LVRSGPVPSRRGFLLRSMPVLWQQSLAL